MIIVAGGDSVIFGSELKDCTNGLQGSYSLSTFSALLAEDNEYHCTAYPGIGNGEIVERVIKRLDTLNHCGVIVSWTWPCRTNELTADEHIIGLQNYLEKRNFPYMFTCLDSCWVYEKSENRNKINWDQWYFFPAGTIEIKETLVPRGFYQWAVESKYSVGPNMHPLEDAHRAAYNLMKEKFDELVTKSI